MHLVVATTFFMFYYTWEKSLCDVSILLDELKSGQQLLDYTVEKV